eukprot:scpid27025/ scgid22790/ WW domain-binding protein 4
MADYWKSNPRRMCDVCKVWMADNKVSISMHEGGKKHKENVQRRISEARKRGVDEIHEKDEIQRQLAAMEKAALAAYKNDVQNDPMLASTGGASTARQHFSIRPARSPGDSSQLSASVECEASGNNADTAEAGDEVGVESAVNRQWSAFSTEEGYVYYYNSATGETTWEKPAGFTSNAAPVVVPAAEEPVDTSDSKTDRVADSKDPKSTDSSGTETSNAGSADSAQAVPSVKSVLSSENISVGEKRSAAKEEEVSGWSASGALTTDLNDSAVADAADDASAVKSEDSKPACAKAEPGGGGFSKKKPSSARDSVFGSWSSVKVSAVTSSRLRSNADADSSTTAAAARTEGSCSGSQQTTASSDRHVDASNTGDDDDDGIGAGLTCRDEEDHQNRFKFQEKTLSTAIADGTSAPSSSSFGMFKKRKRAGGRRERAGDD